MAGLVIQLLLVAGIGFVLSLFYERVLLPLSSIPGPFLASLTRLWITKLAWDGDMPGTILELHRKYGRVVRVAPNEM